MQLREQPPTVSQYIELCTSSGLVRPITEPMRVEAMLHNANFFVTVWENTTLIGLLRALTDWAYVCYIADLAVSTPYQRCGLGKQMIQYARNRLGPHVQLVLISAPTAVAFYEHIGLEHCTTAFVYPRR